MAVYESRLIRRETVAEGTMAFWFERPSGFVHQAGQWVMMSLVDPQESDSRGPNRPFSLVSAPHERELTIATRMRDTAFKRVLASAPPGTPVTIDGPNGVMVLHEDAARPAVLLAGGIGITPFVAMVRDAAEKRLPHRLYLFYSNRRPEDAPFLEELRALEQRNPNYRLIATMTQMEKSSQPWQGETATIGAELLERHVPDVRSPVYYFAGPLGLTMSIQSMLDNLGIAESDMRSEEFYGY